MPDEQDELEGFERPEPIKAIDSALTKYKDLMAEKSEAVKKFKSQKKKLIALLREHEAELKRGDKVIYESDAGRVELVETEEDVRVRPPRKVKKAEKAKSAATAQ